MKSIENKLKLIESKLKSFLKLIDQKNVEGGQKKVRVIEYPQIVWGRGALTLIRGTHYSSPPFMVILRSVWEDGDIGIFDLSIPAVGNEGKIEKNIVQDIIRQTRIARTARGSRQRNSWGWSVGFDTIKIQDIGVIRKLG